MPSKPESAIVASIMRYLSTLPDAYYRKTHGNQFSGRGWPDIELVYQGRFYGLEVKTAKGRATPLQLWRLEKIRAAGGIGEVVTSVEQVKDLIERTGGALGGHSQGR
ncbi:MAG TPA: VRR-NUC domain-containing protein [Bacillota bacterium]|nr:VRR-NUC domain-containing protein [Bacillota bacterium]